MAEINYQSKKLHYGWIILILAVATVMGALGFGRFGYTMLLPSMKTGLSLNEIQAGDLAAGNMLGYLVLALTCGILASRFGPRLVIGMSMIVSAFSLFLTGLSWNYYSALIARTLTGMGGGGSNVPVMGLVSSWFGKRRRGLAAGIAVSGSSFGLLFAGSILPFVLEAGGGNGWRYSWYCLAGAVLIIAVLGFIFLKNSPKAAGLSAVGASEDEKTEAGKQSSSLKWGLIVKTPAVWHLALIYIMFGFSYIIYATFFVRYLSGEGGFSTKEAGGLWALIGGFSIASGFIWGAFSDRTGRKYGLAVVFFIQFLSFTLFGAWKAMPGYIISSVLFALTAWSIPAIMAAAVSDISGPRLAPAALGFITFFFGIGQVLGPMLAGRISAAGGSYSPAFIAAGIAALAGAVLSLFLKKAHGAPAERTKIE